MNAIQVEQLTVSYDKIPVLWDLSLVVPQGELGGYYPPKWGRKEHVS